MTHVQTGNKRKINSVSWTQVSALKGLKSVLPVPYDTKRIPCEDIWQKTCKLSKQTDK